jgi:hypothetical protein
MVNGKWKMAKDFGAVRFAIYHLPFAMIAASVSLRL